ncbi:uncharacterized protein LOC132700880 [Cylas formicarius]|uniref:uncharacterized protein LOC132700880 n=1 Tax=Cylas formicarius TaxID=197179 RepID=UPI002958C6C1|nr:uncharacterized protein LOC132700880 [Cylas formicarius]
MENFFKGWDQDLEHLVRQWAPLVWLQPEEKFMPLAVEPFLENVHIADEKGKILSTSRHPNRFSEYNARWFFLVPRVGLDHLKINRNSFLYGKNPKENAVPVYAVVHHCSDSAQENAFNELKVTPGKLEIFPEFLVTYWMFYPYNEGKEVCFIGKVPAPKIFGRCLGHVKTMGNHIGDWERVSLNFRGQPFPDKMFLSVHDTGSFYTYDRKNNIFKYESNVPRKGVAQVSKFPPFVRIQGGHPVLFSAKGSHGLWSAPGEHQFIRLPKITDKTGYGVPWKTWTVVEFYHYGKTNLPTWITFKGKWGTPKNRCLLLKRLGLCEYSEGPMGLLRDSKDFSCWNNVMK